MTVMSRPVMNTCCARIIHAVAAGSGNFQRGHTYLRHEVGTAAGVAVLKRLTAGGLSLGLELVEDRETRQHFAPKHRLAARIKAEAFETGLIDYPMAGTRDRRMGDHVFLAPPCIIGYTQIGELIDKQNRAIQRELSV